MCVCVCWCGGQHSNVSRHVRCRLAICDELSAPRHILTMWPVKHAKAQILYVKHHTEEHMPHLGTVMVRYEVI